MMYKRGEKKLRGKRKEKQNEKKTTRETNIKKDGKNKLINLKNIKLKD